MNTRPWITCMAAAGLLHAAAASAAEPTPNSTNAPGPATKYVRFEKAGKVAYGIYQSGGTIHELDGDLFGQWEPTDRVHRLADVRLLVPCVPTKVLAMAGNYRSHLGDDTPPPEVPQPFFKPPSCLIAARQPIELPDDSAPVHYEAEMVVVIGERATDVSVDEALDYVLGVTCGNDVSARDWQKNDVQWWRAKGSDTFGPVGPWIVSGLDYDHLDVELRLNGEVRQKTNTSELVFAVAETVSFISRYVTLEPGDLIFTGTPGQTGPLTPGDRVEVELEGVGVLRNPVVAEK